MFFILPQDGPASFDTLNKRIRHRKSSRNAGQKQKNPERFRMASFCGIIFSPEHPHQNTGGDKSP